MKTKLQFFSSHEGKVAKVERAHDIIKETIQKSVLILKGSEGGEDTVRVCCPQVLEHLAWERYIRDRASYSNASALKNWFRNEYPGYGCTIEWRGKTYWFVEIYQDSVRHAKNPNVLTL